MTDGIYWLKGLYFEVTITYVDTVKNLTWGPRSSYK